MRTRAVNDEVLYPDEPVVAVRQTDMARLVSGAGTNARRRMRLCAHRSVEDAVHEMLIVLARGTYIRPHKHLHKSESFHVIAGQAEMILFDDDGGIKRLIALGDYASGACFYYRLADPWYHAVLVKSTEFVYHETTNGPFDPAQTVFAHWSPPEDDAAATAAFLSSLNQAVESYWRNQA